MLLEHNLGEMEVTREKYFRGFRSSSPIKLRWRAMTVRHCFHVLPGEELLELGAGSGLWTQYLSQILGPENHITAAVFNAEFLQSDLWSGMGNVTPVLVDQLASLGSERFDYVVGTGILCHDRYDENLKAIWRLLKPGGQILFFENNLWNPQVFLKTRVRAIGRWAGNASCQVGMRKFEFLRRASHQGFVNVDVIPYDIIHPMLPAPIIPVVQSFAYLFEHAPVIRDLCGTLYLWARKPGNPPVRAPVKLTRHPEFFGAVSFVVPSHNEEMNVGPLVDSILKHYREYVHEILIVNDNSTDDTAEVTREIARCEPCVKLVDRTPPNGVGRALRDGYAAATGKYILTMDCDFVQIVPELRDLFDAVASGYDGAIGSRFTHESIMVNYPFLKILCNRTFHLLARIILRCSVRDISNNLKLYRAEVLKNLEISQPHFAANAETGLKPVMAGYRIKEVPVSWINRTVEMGKSSFRIFGVGPQYLLALWDVIVSSRRLRRPAAARSGRLLPYRTDH